MSMIVDLTRLKPGEEGVVREIIGGPGLIRRLENMGIRTGRKIRKMSSHFWHGPQTVQVGNTNLALGYGMAKKILVEVER